MKKMSLRTVVEWTPREGNREADRLANGQWDDFDEALRIPVVAADLVWEILPAALEMGRVAEEEYEGAKSGPGLPDRCRMQKRRKLEDRLRIADPW